MRGQPDEPSDLCAPIKGPSKVLLYHWTYNYYIASRYFPELIILGQKSRRTKVSRIFRFFVWILPRILLRIFPDFFEEFSCFILGGGGDGDQKKIYQKSRHFSMQNSQAHSKKKSTTFFWRSVKVDCVWCNAIVYIDSRLWINLSVM